MVRQGNPGLGLGRISHSVTYRELGQMEDHKRLCSVVRGCRSRDLAGDRVWFQV